MFRRILVESHLRHSPRVAHITNHFPRARVVEIDRIENYFGKVKKDYLQKRTDLRLFLGEKKKGALVKEAPRAYGSPGNPHFYFVNAYNCIYECNYCYLQGYFHSPDVVLFLNYSDMVEEARRVIDTCPKDSPPWFHAGEFSDSLALSHLTDELDTYSNFFSRYPEATLELRTKSANVAPLLKVPPIPNMIASFSLSPGDKIKYNDLKTPPLIHRLKAMEKLKAHGLNLAIHFDPIIYDEDILGKYTTLLDTIDQRVPLTSVKYFSLGVVRFTRPVYREVKKNYPASEALGLPLDNEGGNLFRYPRIKRHWIMNRIKEMILARGVNAEQVYLCMDDS